MKPVEILSAALQNSPVTLSITSTMDNRYIDVNKTFERFTGYARGEVIGRTPSDLGTWVDYSQRVALLNRLGRERSIHGIESRFRRRVGQIWTGLSSLELIEIDQEPCAIMITADITEHKMAEAHSRMSQDFDLQTETPRQLIGDVVSRLVDLSNSLYPRTLDYLGLAGAADSFCKELSVTDNKKITFRDERPNRAADQYISLPLSRFARSIAKCDQTQRLGRVRGVARWSAK